MTDDCWRPVAVNTDTFARIGASGEMTIPYGETSFTELRTLYKQKTEPLADDCTGFLLEGMTLLADLRAAVLECRKYSKPVFVMLDIDSELLTEHELPADAALIVMQSLGAICFGVSADSAETLSDGIRRLFPYARIPLGVRLKGRQLSEDEITGLLECGCEVFIGMDETTQTCFQNIVSSRKYVSPEPETVDSLMLANERSAFFLEHDTTEISPPIECSSGMGEEIMNSCSQGYDVLRVQINTPDDALDFADNAHLATLPVMFSGDDEIAMKLALMLYQGRALIDSESLIDPDELKNAAHRYGAVIY